MRKSLLFIILLLNTPLALASFEQGMAHVQLGEFAKAEPFLLAEAEKGNRDAMYWLGFALQKQSFEKGVQAGGWYYKAAELGDPWAIAVLANKNTCSFMGWHCLLGKEWRAKQHNAWKEMAANGDGNAEYILATYDFGWKEYFLFLRPYERVRRLKKAVEMGSGRAAYALAGEIGAKESVKYLLIAANNGYVPAMSILRGYHEVLGDDVVLYWLHKALEAGSKDAASGLKFAYYEGSYGLPKDDELQYYYCRIYSGLGQRGCTFMSPRLPDDVRNRIRKQANEWLATHPKNHFYDVTSTMFD